MFTPIYLYIAGSALLLLYRLRNSWVLKRSNNTYHCQLKADEIEDLCILANFRFNPVQYILLFTVLRFSSLNFDCRDDGDDTRWKIVKEQSRESLGGFTKFFKFTILFGPLVNPQDYRLIIINYCRLINSNNTDQLVCAIGNRLAVRNISF